MKPPTASPCSTLAAVLASAIFASASSLGCAAAHKGMVEVEPASVGAADAWLRTSEGRRYRLRLDEDSQAVRAMEGCIVDVEGKALGRSLLVRSWQVTDAGDGSAPYVGALRQHGSNLVIDDRNSGMPLVLDPGSATRLVPHVGKYLMISGYVVGAQTLHAVSFRILIE